MITIKIGKVLTSNLQTFIITTFCFGYPEWPSGPTKKSKRASVNHIKLKSPVAIESHSCQEYAVLPVEPQALLSICLTADGSIKLLILEKRSSQRAWLQLYLSILPFGLPRRRSSFRISLVLHRIYGPSPA